MNYSFLLVSAGMLLLSSSSSQSVNPTELLPDKENYKIFKDVYVRKGTVAATIKNISELNDLILKKGNEEEIVKLIKEQRPLCKGLWALELTDLQPLNLWIDDLEQPGRILVATFILQDCPQLLTRKIKDRLGSIREKLPPLLQQEIDKLPYNS